MLECATNVCHASVQILDVQYANDLGRVHGAMMSHATGVMNSDAPSVVIANVPCAAYVIVCNGTRTSALDANRSHV